MKHELNVINDLLSKDKKRFSYFIPTIQKFKDEEIEALYSGDMEYKFENVPKPYFFKLLQYKFENFRDYLEEWGKEDKYDKYKPYLIELWTKYPCIEEMQKITDEKELVKQMEDSGIKYSTWPDFVKKSFLKQKNNAQNTILFQAKDEIIKKIKTSSDFIMIQRLKNLKEKIHKSILKDENKKKFEKITISTILAFLAEACKDYFIGKNIKEAKELEESSNEFKNGLITLQDYLGKIKKYCPSAYRVIIMLKGWCSNLLCKGDIDSIKPTTPAPKDVNIFQKTLGSDVFAIYFLTRSIETLVSSTIKMDDILNQIRPKIEKHKKELNRIRMSFEQHMDSISGLDCYFETVKINNIQKILIGLEKDYDDLVNLIDDIEKTIQDLESKKSESTKDLIGAGIGVLCSIVGFAIAKDVNDGVAAVNGLSSLINLANGGMSITNIVLSIGSLEEANKLFDDAKALRKEMKEKIEKVLDEINGSYPHQFTEFCC